MTADTAINIATLVAALAAAIISYLNYKREGRAKIAEFRRDWIENLREHMAQFHSEMLKSSEYIDHSKIQYHLEYILLCLNTKEESHKTLATSLVNLRGEAWKEKRDSSAFGSYLQSSRAVLKAEWERLKGEMK